MDTQVTLGIAVMAHPARLEQATELANSVGGVLCLDTDGRGENANGDSAWQTAADQGKDWSVVLQDDAILVPDFCDHVDRILSVAPATAVSFYIGTGRPYAIRVNRAVSKLEETGSAWLSHSTLLWGVAVAMPTSSVPGFLEWASNQQKLPYDRRIGTYWEKQGVPVLYTYPCLVDHADGPTLLNHQWGPPDAPRKAHKLGIPTGLDLPPVCL